MNMPKHLLSKCLIVIALLLMPSLVYAAPGKGWKKPYAPKSTSEAELFKACAYGNAKACYKYRDLYIIPQCEAPGKQQKKK